jgi:hypothetical protein
MHGLLLPWGVLWPPVEGYSLGNPITDVCMVMFAVPCPVCMHCFLQVRSICEEMTMDGCERCMPSWQAGKTWADCDLLDTYSYLCYQMPDMRCQLELRAPESFSGYEGTIPCPHVVLC